MGVLHYALNHTRKEAFILGKPISDYGFAKDQLPKTYEEMYAYVWSQLDPDENFVDRDYGTPEEAHRVAKMLWEWGVEDGVSDSGDMIEEQYHDYRFTGSIYENDEEIGRLMHMYDRHDMSIPGQPMTMVVSCKNGYERRVIDHVVETVDYSYGRPMTLRKRVPQMSANEQMIEGNRIVCGMRIPMIVEVSGGV